MNAEKQNLFSMAFLLLVFISFLGSVNGNGLHNAVSILVENAGGSAAFSGAVTAAFSATALIARFIAGPLSDKKGRRIVMIIGSVLIALGCAFAVVTTSTWTLLPTRVLMGFGFSMVVTANIAAIADVVPPSRLGEAIGYQGLAYALAMAIGPAVAVSLANTGRVSVFGIFCCTGVVCLILSLMLRLPKQPEITPSPEAKALSATPEKQGNALGNFIFKYIEFAALRPAVVILLVYIPMTLYMAFMSLYAAEEGIDGISIYFIVAAVVMIIVRVAFGKAFDRYHINLLLIPSLMVGIVGLALPLIFNNEAALIASGACYGIYCGFSQPLLTTESLRRSPEERHGAASAMYNIGCDVGVVTASLLWGEVIASAGYQLAFGIAIGIIVLTIVAALALLRAN